MKKPNYLRTAFHVYALGNQVGQGANSFVYEAKNEEEFPIAVKVLDAGKSTRRRMLRFENEYRFCSSVKHPHIIQVVDHGLHEENVPFLVMPLFEGSLRSLVGSIEPGEVLPLFAKILSGLEAAHLLGVIHRDLKPENILVRDGGLELAIADFGISAFHDEDLYVAVETDSRERLGSFQYSAPEQKTRGAVTTPQTDIYSLGLILNELFTGELAIAQDYHLVGDVQPDFAFLDSVIHKMLQQVPERRFASIAAIEAAIELNSRDFQARQKISALSGQVIPDEEIDDPLASYPVEIVGKDWNDDVLTLSLSQPLTDKWYHVMASKTPGLSYYTGLEPGRYRVKGNEVVIAVGAQHVKKAYDQFVRWLPAISKAYRGEVEKEQREERRRQVDAVEAARKKEERRRRVLEELEESQA